MVAKRHSTILRRLRRGLSLAARIVGVTLAAVVLVVVAMLLLRPGRQALLHAGLDLARGSLPGELALDHSDWPRLGRLELDGLVWTEGADTLVRLDTLRLALDISDLLRRDLTVREALFAGITADLPAIQRRLPMVAVSDSAAAPASPPAFPRAGSLPPIPSFAVDRLVVRRLAAVTAPDRIVHLDSLSARLDLRHGHDPDLELLVRARPLPGIGLAWRLAGGVAGDSLALDLTSLLVTAPASLTAPDDLPFRGRLCLPLALLAELATGQLDWPRLDLRGLTITGDAGNWRLDARLDGRRPGRISLYSDLPEPPLALLTGLGVAGIDTLAPGLLDTLVARWAAPGLPGLALEIDLRPPPAPAPPSQAHLTARGRLRLPAPAALSPLLPSRLEVADLSRILADLDIVWDGRIQPPALAARIDLGRTDWITSACLQTAGDTTFIRLDSLVLRLPGLALSGNGQVDRDSLSLDLSLDLPDATLLQRWDDPALDGLELGASARLRAAGPLPLPRIDLQAEAAINAPRVRVPRMSLMATGDRDTLGLKVTFPEGLQSERLDLEAASFTFAGACSDSLRHLNGRFRLAAQAPRAALLFAGHLLADDLTTAPAATLTGDTLVLDLAGHGLSNHTPWQIFLTAADSSLTLSDLALDGDLGHVDLSAALRPDSLAAELGLGLALAFDALASLLPPETRTLLPQGTIIAAGGLKVSGPPAAPWARGDLRLSVADNPDLAGLTAETRLALGGTGTPPPELAIEGNDWREASARVNLFLHAADTLLIRVAALLPLPRPDASPDSVNLRLAADGMDLERLQPLLPNDISVSGRLDADVRVAGLMAFGQRDPDLTLSGRLALTDLRLDLPDGSWMALGGAVELDGSSLTPVIDGGLDIEAGLIRLPEPPPILLPVTGEALLWTAAAPAAGSPVAVTSADSTGLPEPLPDILPDLTFSITCPGNLWLRGQGLDVELAGDLALYTRDGVPALGGELRAVQGTMRQLGHVFTLERGRLVFYADEAELNPELELVLEVRIESYLIAIQLTGTANEPELDFTSEPELSDGDIMATLLFGKPLDELDEGQSALLVNRAGDIAAAYGSVKLQEGLGRELGLDVLTIAPREDDSETTALTVGKYLDPQVMVYYEQLLREESAFYLHLNYSFLPTFKLHTQISQGEESGVELKWEQDW